MASGGGAYALVKVRWTVGSSAVGAGARTDWVAAACLGQAIPTKVGSVRGKHCDAGERWEDHELSFRNQGGWGMRDGAMPVGEEAVMADAVEPVGQGVEDEPADELVCREGHDLRATVMAIIPPAESDVINGHVGKPCIGNRDAMGVAAEIGRYQLGTPEGGFGIDDPFDAPQCIEPVGEGSGFCERRGFSEEAEPAGGERGAELGQEQPAKEPREHPHREEEAGTTADPALAVERGSAARHDAVGVRMMLEVLAPGMEHADETNRHAEMLRIGGDGSERPGRVSFN